MNYYLLQHGDGEYKTLRCFETEIERANATYQCIFGGTIENMLDDNFDRVDEWGKMHSDLKADGILLWDGRPSIKWFTATPIDVPRGTIDEFEREQRYFVVKLKDANKYLTQNERSILERLSAQCDLGRIDGGRFPLQCVCVESDWPEYEPTWIAIEERVSKGINKDSDPHVQECWVPGCDGISGIGWGGKCNKCGTATVPF